MFHFVSVCKFYGGKAVLTGIDLDIPPNKTTVLIGPSGSGKSTMLAMMTGLLRPDRGELLFESTPLTAERMPAVRRRIGYVIQDGGLFPHLTGLANVALMARHLGWDERAVDRRIGELSALTRMPRELLSRYPAEISGGQRQRISLMRALMLEPEVLLLDEPFGALDPMIRSELRDDLLAVFREFHKTVVLVTHDLGEAAFFADNIVLMREGRIVQIGDRDALFNHPADPFVERFVKAQQIRFPGEPQS